MWKEAVVVKSYVQPWYLPGGAAENKRQLRSG